MSVQVYKRKNLECEMSPMETQNFLHRLTADSLSSGHKVVRILTPYTDGALRTRRTIEEVRICELV